MRKTFIVFIFIALASCAFAQGTINGIPNQSMSGGSTGLTPSVTGDLLTFSNTVGGLQDSGVLLSSLATTASVTAAISSVKALSFTTLSIGGTLINVGCTNQTPVTVTGATTSMACVMSGAGGTQPANIQPQCFVSAANTVTPQFCTSITLGVTPVSQTYNIRVF